MKHLLLFSILLFSFLQLAAYTGRSGSFAIQTTSSQAYPTDSIDIETYLFQHNMQTKQTEEGLHYRIEVRGSGNYPKPGDYVMVNYVGRLLDGTVFDASEEEPFVFQLGYRQVIRAWEFGIPLFQIGSKGTLFVPPQLGYGKAGAGKVVPPNSALIYEIEVLRIMDELAYDEYMEALDERERVAFENAQKEQHRTDNKIINDYTREHKLKTKRLASGVSYAIKKKGKGKLPQTGDKVSIHYEGFLTDGTRFDSSYDRNETFDFTVGKGKVIQGLDEAIQYFKKGSSGWILIPSKHAYGPMEIDEESTFIPANAVLIFKVKLERIEEGLNP